MKQELQDKICIDPSDRQSVLRLALRCLLGYGMSLDFAQSRQYATMLGAEDPLGLEIKRIADACENSPHHQAEWQVFQGYDFKTTKHLPIVNQKLATSREASDCLKDILWSIRQLQEVEGWCADFQDCIGSYWRFSYQRAVDKDTMIDPFLAFYNTDRSQLEKSIYAMGPAYNKVDQYGRPILGAWLAPGESIFSGSDHSFVDADAYCPGSGIIAFNGLTGHPDGTISFHTVAAGDRPALLLSEDFFVAMAMIFVCGQMPSLSLNIIKEKPPIDAANSHNRFYRYMMEFSKKTWSPEWLGHTALGKTLYSTDQLLCDFLFTLSAPPFILQPAEARDERLPDLAADFMKAWVKVPSFKKQYPDEATISALRIHSHAGNASQVLQSVDGRISVLPIKANPRIRTYFYGSDKLSELCVNDPQYQNGAYASFLTENFNTWATLIPIYERYRQLMSLCLALKTLKDNPHFQISSELETDLRDLVQSYQSRPPLTPAMRTVENTRYFI